MIGLKASVVRRWRHAELVDRVHQFHFSSPNWHPARRSSGAPGASHHLAGQAIKAGLADEVRLFLVPVVVGGSKRALPDGVRSDLELLDTQRFASGAVYLRYCLQSA
jgi:RibD domain-containing protein